MLVDKHLKGRVLFSVAFRLADLSSEHQLRNLSRINLVNART